MIVPVHQEVKKLKLFTIGPVMMYPETLQIESMQQPYFRNPQFSAVMLDIEKWFLESIGAPQGSRFIALTASGTGAMDASVSNLLNEKDKVLVINGGSFGARFAELCSYYGIPHTDYVIPFGKAFDKEEFEKYSGQGFTALLVNACDTGTGQLYDLDYLGEFCAREGILLIVDAVSAYLADPIDMTKQHIDVLFTASQKALALSPGVSLIALGEKALERIGRGRHAYYFDFADYIENQKRGQPPFTSAVGTLLAMHQRLEAIRAQGVDEVIEELKKRAALFRERLRELPVTVPDIPLSNCCTPVVFPKGNAWEVYEALISKYDIVLTPSGGALRDKQLRVGHLGNLTLEDLEDLADKLGEELEAFDK